MYFPFLLAHKGFLGKMFPSQKTLLLDYLVPCNSVNPQYHSTGQQDQVSPLIAFDVAHSILKHNGISHGTFEISISKDLPVWDLSSLYPGMRSSELKQDLEKLPRRQLHLKLNIKTTFLSSPDRNSRTAL